MLRNLKNRKAYINSPFCWRSILIALCSSFLFLPQCMEIWGRYTRCRFYQRVGGALGQVFEAEIKIGSSCAMHKLDMFKALTSVKQAKHVSVEVYGSLAKNMSGFKFWCLLLSTIKHFTLDHAIDDCSATKSHNALSATTLRLS